MKKKKKLFTIAKKRKKGPLSDFIKLFQYQIGQKSLLTYGPLYVNVCLWGMETYFMHTQNVHRRTCQNQDLSGMEI